METRKGTLATDRFRILRYCSAVAFVGLALAMTLLIEPLRDQPGCLLFFVAVMLATWHGGLVPGLLATAVSAAALHWIALPDVYSAGKGAADAVRVGVFVFLAVFISSLQTRWRRSERCLAAGEVELEIARKIQRRLFPATRPALAGFDIAAACYPAQATGGDYFDYFAMPSGRVGIAVGDVSGHGFGPALLMAELHACLRALALTSENVDEMLTLANSIVFCDTAEGQFVTVFLGCLDPDTRSFVYASAGHEGYLLHVTGAVTKLPSTGLPLGLLSEEVIRPSSAITLAADDIVLLVTDGCYEAKSPHGTSLGMPRVIDLVRANCNLTATQIVDVLCQEAQRHTGGLPQGDDITVLVIKAFAVASNERQLPRAVPPQFVENEEGSSCLPACACGGHCDCFQRGSSNE